jgi:hypothetical protein
MMELYFHSPMRLHGVVLNYAKSSALIECILTGVNITFISEARTFAMSVMSITIKKFKI